MEVLVLGKELLEEVKKLDKYNLFDFKLEYYENGDPKVIFGKSEWTRKSETLAMELYHKYNNVDFVEVNITLDDEGGELEVKFDDRDLGVIEF